MRERKTRIEKHGGKSHRIIVKTVRYVIGFIIICIFAYMTYGIYQEARIRNITEGALDDLSLSNLNVMIDETLEKEQATNQIENQSVEQKAFIPVTAQYNGYSVDCRLEVPKIDLNTNVLTNYTKEGLKICASKYYGPKANEIGNYCIAGHNYQRENMFNHLIDLEIGDSIFLTDNKNGKIEYTIYDIYKVKPENVEPLSQETRGEKEITLITCVNYSKNRLVVKAIEKKA